MPRHEILPPTPAELGRLLHAAEAHEDPLQALWTTAIYSGCRLGELLGLKWEDVDIARGTLSVRRTLVAARAGVPTFGEPKSAQSRRSVKLPPIALAALRAHRDRQTWDRQALSEDYPEYGLVFATSLGTAYLAADISHRFKRAAARAGSRSRFASTTCVTRARPSYS